MTSDTVLTNFYVPLDIRNRFDDVCRLIGRTRTSVLVELMDSYIVSKGPEITSRYRAIANLDQSLAILSRSNDDKQESSDPPGIWISTGREDW